MLEGHLALGESSFYMGSLASAEKHLTQVDALYNSDKHRPHATRNVQDPAVAARFHLALAIELRGYPDQAAKISRAALSLAQDLSHPFSLAYALNGAALFHQIRREVEFTRKLAEAALVASRDGGFSLFTAEATFLLGWAHTQQGQTEEGIVQMRQGLAAWRATGAELLCPLFLGSLADGCSNVGSIGDASGVMAEAMVAVQRSDEQMYAPELYRLNGEMQLLNEASKSTAAEKYFRDAMDLAHRQGAKLWELRAATSLSRLLHKQNRRDEVIAMLADIYGWFTEGFNTVDLKEAKALLDELAQ
jgi:predicted ATPase